MQCYFIICLVSKDKCPVCPVCVKFKITNVGNFHWSYRRPCFLYLLITSKPNFHWWRNGLDKMIFSKVNIEWFTYFIKMSEFIEKYAYVNYFILKAKRWKFFIDWNYLPSIISGVDDSCLSTGMYVCFYPWMERQTTEWCLYDHSLVFGEQKVA